MPIPTAKMAAAVQLLSGVRKSRNVSNASVPANHKCLAFSPRLVLLTSPAQVGETQEFIVSVYHVVASTVCILQQLRYSLTCQRTRGLHPRAGSCTQPCPEHCGSVPEGFFISPLFRTSHPSLVPSFCLYFVSKLNIPLKLSFYLDFLHGYFHSS